MNKPINSLILINLQLINFIIFSLIVNMYLFID